MAKGSKPDFYLRKLRKNGVTNVIDIRLKLCDAFPDLTTNQAAEVLAYWMHTFAGA